MCECVLVVLAFSSFELVGDWVPLLRCLARLLLSFVKTDAVAVIYLLAEDGCILALELAVTAVNTVGWADDVSGRWSSGSLIM